MTIDNRHRTAIRHAFRRRRLAPSLLAVGVDTVMILLSLFLAWRGRVGIDWFEAASNVDDLVGPAVPPIAVGWVVALAIVGSYSAKGMGAGTTEYRKVVTASWLTAGSIGVVCYLLRYPLSRGLFFLTFIIGLPALIVGRVLLRRVLHRLHERGNLLQHVLLVGGPAQVDDIAKVLRRERWLGYHVLGALGPVAQEVTATAAGVPVLGATHDLTDVVARTDPDIVLFVGGVVRSARDMRRLAWSLEGSGARVMLVPSLTDVSSDRVTIRPAAGLPLMELDGPGAHRTAHTFKRAFDMVGAIALLVLTAPILLGAAIAIRRHDGGPIIHRQTRIGRDSEPFECLKLRSMVVGAEDMRAEVTSDHDPDHVLFKAKEDPRITGPGRVIRRYSIDELPQLVNVLQGSMSLVGPRPPLPEEVARYTEEARRRLTVRPGLTGLWQVSGRSELSWEDTVRLDLYYVDNWSALRDLVILARTVHVVLLGRGAY